jgi:pre-mRNA-processing factor 6
LPTDIELWKEAISLEEETEAKALLYSAVKCVPQCTDLWLALAKLETYSKA